MVRGKSKKGEKLVAREIVLPEISQQALASYDGLYGTPSRMYQNGKLVGQEGLQLRYRFNNLWCGIMPFQIQQGYISVRDAIWLCQKAYFNVAVFRNAINTLAELSNTDIYLTGGNQQSQDFFNAWFQRINLSKLKECFFRELFRSGNVFLFRVEGEISRNDALKLSQTYAAIPDSKLQIPLRYIGLNVADMAALNTISFDQPQYFKVLTPQQVQMLKQSDNTDDQEVYKSLPQAIKKYFDAATGTPIALDMSKLHTIFYQKQDYEPFAVPMGFAVLDDINLKLELKKTDAILARTVEYVTLLVTTGSEPQADGTGGVSQAAINKLTQLFNTEQIGRVLVADWSTKLDWSIPDLSKVLGPQKYETVNQDIAQGLLDVFFGSQRYADVAAKLKVFVQKIDRVQEVFLNDFLQAEIRRISKLMNFKSYPTASFVKVSLDDPAQTMRVIAQLIQLGILTAKDGLDALQTGEFPEFSDLLANQKDYKTFKDDGLFQPVISTFPPERVAKAQFDFPKPTPLGGGGGSPPKGKPAQPSGRPPGTKAPQMTKKISPIGTGSEQKFSMTKLIQAIKLQDNIKDKLTVAYKKKHDIKKLKESDQGLINIIATTLFENESPESWEDKIDEYVKTPAQPNPNVISEIETIASEYEVSNDAAMLLYHSKI